MRPAPEEYTQATTVDEAIYYICQHNREYDWCWRTYLFGYCTKEQLETRLKVWGVEEISCDNDLGENEPEGYKLLDWLEATGRNYPIHIHSANPVARERMRAIIQRNGWTEVR